MTPPGDAPRPLTVQERVFLSKVGTEKNSQARAGFAIGLVVMAFGLTILSGIFGDVQQPLGKPGAGGLSLVGVGGAATTLFGLTMILFGLSARAYGRMYDGCAKPALQNGIVCILCGQSRVLPSTPQGNQFQFGRVKIVIPYYTRFTPADPSSMEFIPGEPAGAQGGHGWLVSWNGDPLKTPRWMMWTLE